jgi:hypothetical protein
MDVIARGALKRPDVEARGAVTRASIVLVWHSGQGGWKGEKVIMGLAFNQRWFASVALAYRPLDAPLHFFKNFKPVSSHLPNSHRSFPEIQMAHRTEVT